jgi:hypothetical protein
MSDTTAARDLVAEISEQLRTTARHYCATLAELEPIAVRLADLEGRLRAAQHQVGVYHDVRPPARELAAEIAHGHLQALSPHVPLVVNEAMRRAEEALVSPAKTTGSVPCGQRD